MGEAYIKLLSARFACAHDVSADALANCLFDNVSVELPDVGTIKACFNLLS